MTTDEIIEMARQAGFETMFRKGRIHGFERDGDYTEELENFAKLVAAKEREACAELVEFMWGDANEFSDAIRAKGEA